MPTLEKAYLVEIGAGENPAEVPPRFPVQFNPTTLRLQIASSSAGGVP